MKKIDAILNDSQSILNNIKKKDAESVNAIKNNQCKLERIIEVLDEKNLYKKYIDIHRIILESAQGFFANNNEIYKLQPLFYYLEKENFQIKDDHLKLPMKEKDIIFQYDSKKIEIHDEFYVENDELFEKENIPLLIKEIASKKDLERLNQLENYIKSLISQAEKEIENHHTKKVGY